MSENLLRHEKSPYLLQHAENPVHWRAWGREALQEAQRLDKPILLSVGYAACHWCHVMAHESFEDDGVAAVMNEGFVNIKVDREERPEIDQLYMQALHSLGEQGGWPLTMFLTPDGKPFWGGTYFPKEPRYGRPGFVQVLTEISRLYREERGRVEHNTAAIAEALAPKAPEGKPQLDPRIIAAAGERLLQAFDPVNGSLNGAPKFPQCSILELLEHAGHATGEKRMLGALHHTLRQICRGGINDHIGGGFARYAVDERWLVPHFEKMLYDNAQLVELLTRTYLRSGEPVFRRAVEETVDWLLREMIAEGGAFAASLDADSEGEEGKFYVWSLDEVTEVLGDEAPLFARAYDITEGGNFEGHNIPNRLGDPFPGLPGEEALLDRMRHRLFARREERVRPGRDDKVLADWNGLMIAALADAAMTFERPDWLEAAFRAYRFISDAVSRETRLGHSYRDGALVFPGIAGDHAAMARAALHLREATGAQAFLGDAARWLDHLHAHHWVEGFGYVMAADDADDVTMRIRSAADDAVPNANGLAAEAMIRLYHATGEGRWLERADRLFEVLTPAIMQNPFAHASLVAALDLRIGALQIVVVGPEGPERDELERVARSVADPNLVLQVIGAGHELPAGHPANGKASDGAPQAFVCRGTTCSLPLQDPAALREALENPQAVR
ncbi:thioredoxin domain-containing protein [Lutibaculum baratangense]|nr:thioredoxin domain-containing protein [Lutibaculum baratangense]